MRIAVQLHSNSKCGNGFLSQENVFISFFL
jgi:hypothetical protein